MLVQMAVQRQGLLVLERLEWDEGEVEGGIQKAA
jgi:hypothetical protein